MKLTRRSFLRKLALKGAGREHDHVLVCVFLRGGADTLNMFVPYGDDAYYKARPGLALAHPSKGGSECSIKINDFYALHPRMAPLLEIFKEGRLSAVQAVGSDNPTGSHFEAQDQMEHGEAYHRNVGGGWLGRHMRSQAGGELPLSAVAIGTSIPESLRGAHGASAITTVDALRLKTPSEDPANVCAALASLYGADVGLLSEPGLATLELLNRVQKLSDKVYKPLSGVEYPSGPLGDGMREIARLIKANVGLEVACIDHNGWDTHFFQGSATGLHADNVGELSLALSAFDRDLIKERARVTTIVMTEFGRRSYQNGSMGTDHGRGFTMFALGGKVRGGKIIGKWPGLAEDEEQAQYLFGPTGLKILVDYRSVLIEVLAGALGNHRISDVFPDFTAEPVGLIESTGFIS